jgi:hypothetical protein
MSDPARKRSHDDLAGIGNRRSFTSKWRITLLAKVNA